MNFLLIIRSLLNSTEFPGQNFIEDNFRQVYWQKGQISTKKKEKVKMISDLEPMMLQSEDEEDVINKLHEVKKLWSRQACNYKNSSLSR